MRLPLIVSAWLLVAWLAANVIATVATMAATGAFALAMFGG